MAQKDQMVTQSGVQYVPPKYTHQMTLRYKLFLKTAFVEALINAFKAHPDRELQKTAVKVEYGTNRIDFPNIIVKYYEKSINNVGIGHQEWGPSPSDPFYAEGGPYTTAIPYQHRIYKGDIEFEIQGLTIIDRDKLADALIEIIGMSEVSVGGVTFLERVYDSLRHAPYSEWHFPVIDTDNINPFGEQAGPVPWYVEDPMVYRTSYRVPVMGEFYSLTPEPPVAGTGLVEEVDIYPYDIDDPLDTLPENFPEEIIPEPKYIKIRKRKRVIPEKEIGLETSLVLETSTILQTKATQ